MVEGRATVDREHFMTSHPPTPGSGNVLTPLDGLSLNPPAGFGQWLSGSAAG
jgi:hypothetical protein